MEKMLDPSQIPVIQAFVCTRTKKEGKESCGPKGGEELRERLKDWAKKEGLNKRVKITASLCLGHCENGITVCIHPANKWFIKVDKDKDFEAIKSEILALLKANS